MPAMPNANAIVRSKPNLDRCCYILLSIVCLVYSVQFCVENMLILIQIQSFIASQRLLDCGIWLRLAVRINTTTAGTNYDSSFQMLHTEPFQLLKSIHCVISRGFTTIVWVLFFLAC